MGLPAPSLHATSTPRPDQFSPHTNPSLSLPCLKSFPVSLWPWGTASLLCHLSRLFLCRRPLTPTSQAPNMFSCVSSSLTLAASSAWPASHLPISHSPFFSPHLPRSQLSVTFSGEPRLSLPLQLGQ
ncbi:uncharacterized protein LOC100173360 [Pongo abelii]|uniref:Uncharacterized LOC100173360 n=1 Tax=Pongo abelii TaxID=9601 RepID=Q5R7B6_PONAB|nr:uncharacterized protein LOC100173360 [Pongo abelii]CAH92344.1 hypothetical protein [Pongo abelii]